MERCFDLNEFRRPLGLIDGDRRIRPSRAWMRPPAAAPLLVRPSARGALRSMPRGCCGAMTSDARSSRSAGSTRVWRIYWFRRVQRRSSALRSDTAHRAVAWDRDLDSPEDSSASGINEIDWQAGHCYLSPVHQLGPVRTRHQWVGPERRKETPERFFKRSSRNYDESQRPMSGTILQHYDLALSSGGSAIRHDRVIDRSLVRFMDQESLDYLVISNACQADAAASVLRKQVHKFCSDPASDDRGLARALDSLRLAMGGSRLQ